MLPDRSCSVKQTIAKGNRGPEGTRRGGGNMGLRTRLEPSLSITGNGAMRPPHWMGGVSCTAGAASEAGEREAPPDSRTHIIEN